ncbi:integrase core domain-containing protein, partial [Microbacterium sp. NPDC055357]
THSGRAWAQQHPSRPTPRASQIRCHLLVQQSQALGDDVKHKYTRPYRPQTNGKIERFHRTLADEWAYARHYDSDPQRAASYPAWLHHYNHHRPHTGIGGQSPIDRVHNVRGKNI